MANIREMRTALADALKPVEDLNPYPSVPGVINIPDSGAAVVIQRRKIAFDATFGRGQDDFEFTLTLFAEFGDHDLATEAIDRFLDGSGDTLTVKAAIEKDGTLGGVVNYAWVREVEEDRVTKFGDVDYLTTDIIVVVSAEGETA